MGLVLAGQGLGGFLGMVLVPALSDKLGRKPVMIVALLIDLAALLALMNIGAEPALLFAAVFVIIFTTSGVVSINVGPLTNASVPPAIAATATGLVVGIGEMVGGAFMPALAGGLAESMGISVIIKIAAIAAGLGILIVIFGVREPKPLFAQATP
jgi:MFS family permease